MYRKRDRVCRQLQRKSPAEIGGHGSNTEDFSARQVTVSFFAARLSTEFDTALQDAITWLEREGSNRRLEPKAQANGR